MRKLIVCLALVVCEVCTAGPYVEYGTYYDPTSGPDHTYTVTGDGVMSYTPANTSNYISTLSLGWQWNLKGVLTSSDSIEVGAILYQDRSYMYSSGNPDVISQKGIRGLSLKYVAW
jgi:hypothetical protein